MPAYNAKFNNLFKEEFKNNHATRSINAVQLFIFQWKQMGEVPMNAGGSQNFFFIYCILTNPLYIMNNVFMFFFVSVEKLDLYTYIRSHIQSIRQYV